MLNRALTLIFAQDEFLDIKGAVEFLDSKRTCMQLASIQGAIRLHLVQRVDYLV